jgi:hypothetical protein
MWMVVQSDSFSSSVQTLQAKDKATLVFHRYGDQYFLFRFGPRVKQQGDSFTSHEASVMSKQSPWKFFNRKDGENVRSRP